MSNEATIMNGTPPISDVIFGSIDCTESVFSKKYDTHAVANIAAGQ